MISYIADHFERARDRLVSGVLCLPGVTDALSVLISPYQEIEDALFDLVMTRSLDTHGVWLDRIGGWLDEPRDGLSDTHYKKVLKVSWMSRNKTADDYTHTAQTHIVEMVKLMTDPVKISFAPNPPRGFWLTYVVEAPLDEAYKRKILELVTRATPAGHSVLVAEAVLPYASWPSDEDASHYNTAPIASAIC